MSEQLDQLLEQRSEWTLWQDSMLRRYLKDATENIFKNLKDVESTVNDLDNEAELLSLRLENIHNNIYALKSSKLIEERIVDVPFDEKKDANIKKVEEGLTDEQRTTNAIRQAVERGFQLVDKSFKELTLVSPDFFTEIDPTFTPKPFFEVRNPYANRPLPALIGSSEFYASPTVYQKHEISPEDEKQFVESITVKFPLGNNRGQIPNDDEEEVHNRNIRDPSIKHQNPQIDIRISRNDVPTSSRDTANESKDFGLSIPQCRIPAPINQSPENRPNIQCAVGTSSAQKPLAEILSSQKLSTVPSATSTKASAEFASDDNRSEISERSVQIEDKSQSDLFASKLKSVPTNQLESAATNKLLEKQFEEQITANKKVSATSNSRSVQSHRSDKQELLSTKEVGKKSRKSLFSSSSSSLSSEEERHKLGEEKDQQENIESEKKEREVKEKESDEMPKPVLKAFDANFSDRLSAVLKNNQTTMRDRVSDPSRSKRPVSISTIPLNDDGKAMASTTEELSSRTKSSSVSSNEELGPSSVASRIAQIGNKIPIGRKDAPDIANDNDESSRISITGKPPPAPPPAPSNTAVMTRAKGPARRAPTTGRRPLSTLSMPTVSNDTENSKNKPATSNFNQASGSDLKKAIVAEIAKTTSKSDVKSQSTPTSSAIGKKSEPSIKKDNNAITKTSRESLTHLSDAKTLHSKIGEKTQKKSIFDSSTSDEDDFLTKASRSKTTQQANTVKARESHEARNTNMKSNEPFTTKTNVSRPTASKDLPKKKGLFDDSDSDI